LDDFIKVWEIKVVEVKLKEEEASNWVWDIRDIRGET